MTKIIDTNQTFESFPRWYTDGFWPQMILVPEDDVTYQLVPPNQMDWRITMRFAEGLWHVSAFRPDDGAMFSETYRVK